MKIEYLGENNYVQETNLFNKKIENLLKSTEPTEKVPIHKTRKIRDKGEGIFPFQPENSNNKEVIFWKNEKNVKIRLTSNSNSDYLFLFIHGGGWTFGRPKYEDKWCNFISKKVKCDVGAVEYRLAPEYPWPSCLDDCFLACLWSLEQKYKKIVIGGESAGAHLTAGALLKLEKLNLLKKVKGAVFSYGLFDLRMTPSTRNWGEKRLILSTPTIKWFIKNLKIPKKELVNPLVSPILSELKNMPPALFQCGTLDPLRDDTAFMSSRWSLSGAETHLNWYKNGIHAFDKFDLNISKIYKQKTILFLKKIFFNS